MKVFIVQYDCQDYYCDGDHILEVFATKEDAEHAIVHVAEYWEAQCVIGTSGYGYTIAEYEVLAAVAPST